VRHLYSPIKRVRGHEVVPEVRFTPAIAIFP
jgi:hypothetical protein